jgi:hypothetical protein
MPAPIKAVRNGWFMRAFPMIIGNQHVMANIVNNDGLFSGENRVVVGLN